MAIVIGKKTKVLAENMLFIAASRVRRDHTVFRIYEVVVIELTGEPIKSNRRICYTRHNGIP